MKSIKYKLIELFDYEQLVMKYNHLILKNIYMSNRGV